MCAYLESYLANPRDLEGLKAVLEKHGITPTNGNRPSSRGRSGSRSRTPRGRRGTPSTTALPGPPPRV